MQQKQNKMPRMPLLYDDVSVTGNQKANKSNTRHLNYTERSRWSLFSSRFSSTTILAGFDLAALWIMIAAISSRSCWSLFSSRFSSTISLADFDPAALWIAIAATSSRSCWSRCSSHFSSIFSLANFDLAALWIAIAASLTLLLNPFLLSFFKHCLRTLGKHCEKALAFVLDSAFLLLFCLCSCFSLLH